MRGRRAKRVTASVTLPEARLKQLVDAGEVEVASPRRDRVFSVRHRGEDVDAWQAQARRQFGQKKDAVPLWIEARLNGALTREEVIVTIGVVEAADVYPAERKKSILGKLKGLL